MPTTYAITTYAPASLRVPRFFDTNGDRCAKRAAAWINKRGWEVRRQVAKVEVWAYPSRDDAREGRSFDANGQATVSLYTSLGL
jgi:hypothetical protein